MNNEEIIQQRIPVWQAISTLALNEMLSKDEIDRIVDRCRESGYSTQELETIYRYEVVPSINANTTLFSDLDFWAGYENKELQSFITSYTDSKYIKDLSAAPSFIEKIKSQFFAKSIKKNWLEIMRKLENLNKATD